jgi:hypothetical protein
LKLNALSGTGAAASSAWAMLEIHAAATAVARISFFMASLWEIMFINEDDLLHWSPKQFSCQVTKCFHKAHPINKIARSSPCCTNLRGNLLLLTPEIIDKYDISMTYDMMHQIKA